MDIFSKRTINYLNSKKLSKKEKEHLNLYITNNPKKFKTDFKKIIWKNKFRLTLDTQRLFGNKKKLYFIQQKVLTISPNMTFPLHCI